MKKIIALSGLALIILACFIFANSNFSSEIKKHAPGPLYIGGHPYNYE
ncbi:hypothetical protein ACFVAD_20325 [Sutcliffiella sp. NPDC057660]